MKREIIFLIVFLFWANLIAQKWDNTYGTSNHIETHRDVVESYDHGYLISGSYKIPSSSNWLIKTDINGNVLWDKVILHDLHDVFSGNLDQNSLGEIAIGRCISQDNGDQWPTVVKLDSCGNKLWCREFINDEYSHGWLEDVILFDNGDVLALGYLFTQENYNERIFLYYIDANGNLIWRQSYASKENHPLVLERIGYGIHKFDNEYIINGWCAYPYPGNPGTGYMRPFYIGIDNEFKEKWILPFGVYDSIIGMANNVINLNDSIYMGVGFKWETGSQNSILMFFNTDGEELGYNQIYNDAIGPDITDNNTGDISRLNDTLFITTAFFGTGAGINANGEFIIDTATNIYKIEQRSNTTGTSTIVKTFDDKYVIGCSYRYPSSDRDIYLYKINDSLQHDTVYPGNYTYDSLCPYEIESGIIDITNCLLVTDVGEVPTPQEYFASLNTILIKAYPNPAKEGSITFQYSNTEYLTPPSVPPQGGKPPHLAIYNVYGDINTIDEKSTRLAVDLVKTNHPVAGLEISHSIVDTAMHISVKSTFSVASKGDYYLSVFLLEDGIDGSSSTGLYRQIGTLHSYPNNDYTHDFVLRYSSIGSEAYGEMIIENPYKDQVILNEYSFSIKAYPKENIYPVAVLWKYNQEGGNPHYKFINAIK